MAKKGEKTKSTNNKKHPDLINFRLKEPYLSELIKLAEKEGKSHTMMAKEIICSFFDSVNNKNKEKGKKNIQLKFTKNVMEILEHFMQKHGIEDYSVAFNYLLLRGMLLEVRLAEVDNINVSEVWDEMIKFKRMIKNSYIKKLATQRIERLQEANKAQIEALSKYTD